ncbi:MAG: hypothetical protein RMJ83_10180 [Armatimonadota bacterium]|nr:hypothetical protein [Armatimonadota bacterium]
MRRWAVRIAPLLSVLWVALFLTANLLHPLAHNPLESHDSDCFVCVLQKTPAPQPPAHSETLQALTDSWSAWRPSLPQNAPPAYNEPALLPLIPRAPPA